MGRGFMFHGGTSLSDADMISPGMGINPILVFRNNYKTDGQEKEEKNNGNPEI